jgi:hypothetical protein
MSRYVCHFLVTTSSEHMRSVLKKMLETCRLELIYEVTDYLNAREIPGRVSFARLATVEVLIDATNATKEAVKLTLVVKNEELPLNSNNHCRQMFDLLRSTIARNPHWHQIPNLQSNGSSSVKTMTALPTVGFESPPATDTLQATMN